MTEDLPGIENATWLQRRLERRPAPPASSEPPPAQRSATISPTPPLLTRSSPAPITAAPAMPPRQLPPPLPLNGPSAPTPPPRAPSPNLLRPGGAPAAPPGPASSLWHSAPPSFLAQPRELALPGRPVFGATFALRLAQLVVAAQAGIALVTGIDLIRGTTSLAQLGSGVNLAATPSLAAHYGIGIIVVGALLMIGVVAVALPSQIVRTLIVVIEVVTLGLTLAAHFGGGSVLGFETVIGVGATGSALIPFGAAVGLQSAVIYLLAVHPPTYRAFAR